MFTVSTDSKKKMFKEKSEIREKRKNDTYHHLK